MQPASSGAPVYGSGDWEIDLTGRELRLRGIPVSLGNRGFDILEVLVQSAGALVTKDALIGRVWPGVIVDENTLQAQISAVRKAFGRDRSMLQTVPGRGYRLLGDWRVHAQGASENRPAEAPAAHPPVQKCSTNLPAELFPLIGRTGAVQQLLEMLHENRAVTLTGPGGIGKTTLATQVARAAREDFAGAAWLVELASLSDPGLAPSAVARALDLNLTAGGDLNESVARAIGGRKVLLVLDNCEHLIDAAAQLTETIIRLCPHATILATSREALRIAGEVVYRVPPLDIPPERPEEPSAILRHSAVQLFTARTQARNAEFVPDGESLPLVAAICRQLDGIPLAIEFAAARTATLGIRDVASRLDDRFALLTSGRRTALARHQTLTATLDWSYELLSEQGRRLLRLLAVFAGGFTLDAAAGLFDAGSPTLVAAELTELVSKSLVVADVSIKPVRYRLLDTTRLYGLNKLDEDGELQQVRRAHAEYFRDLFAGADAACETLPQQEWLATYAAELANVRAALDWAASAAGDVELCVALTIGVVPLWVQLSLMSECRGRAEHALGLLAGDVPAVLRSRMQLCAAEAWSLMYGGGQADEIGSAWAATMQLAEQLGDNGYRLRAFWGLWINQANKGNFREALHLARQLTQLVSQSKDTLDHVLADRLLGTTLHYRGDQTAARHSLEQMLSRYAAAGNQPRVARFQVDPRATANQFLARVLWLQGYAHQARRLIETNIAEGSAVGHALSLSNILGQSACPIGLLAGDLATARRHVAMLLEHEREHGLHLWRDWAACFDGLLAVKQGEIEAGLATMRDAFERAGDARFLPRFTLLQGEFAASLGLAGCVSLGLEIIDALLQRCDGSEERWYVPEALRIKGELIALADSPDRMASAEACFSQAIALAKQQEALSWELRAAISRARIWRDQGRCAEVQSQLSEILGRFSEGFETSDLLRARKFLLDDAVA